MHSSRGHNTGCDRRFKFIVQIKIVGTNTVCNYNRIKTSGARLSQLISNGTVTIARKRRRVGHKTRLRNDTGIQRNTTINSIHVSYLLVSHIKRVRLNTYATISQLIINITPYNRTFKLLNPYNNALKAFCPFSINTLTGNNTTINSSVTNISYVHISSRTRYYKILISLKFKLRLIIPIGI